MRAGAGEGVAGARPFPGFWQSVGLLALLAAFYVPAGVLKAVLGWPVGTPSSGSSWWSSDLIDAATTAAAYAPVLWLGWRWARPWRPEVFPFRRVRATSAMWFVVAQVGLLAALVPVNHAIARALPDPPELLVRRFATLGVLTGVVVIPVAEELLCRGLVLGGMLQRYGASKAIVLSALFFALIHLNPWQFTPALFLGVFYAWTARATGGLWLPIAGHVIANGSAWLSLRERVEHAVLAAGAPRWAIGVAGLSIAAAGVGLLHRTAPGGACRSHAVAAEETPVGRAAVSRNDGAGPR